ncbi:hypothetical protein E2320_015307 [Naja naja]|nr:hypothetical protein E2320_015307 [Naja naja]
MLLKKKENQLIALAIPKQHAPRSTNPIVPLMASLIPTDAFSAMHFSSQDEARVNSAHYSRPYISVLMLLNMLALYLKKLKSSGFSSSVLYLSLHSESHGIITFKYYGKCKQ